MILRGWLYRGQRGPWDEFRTTSFILEESVYDFEHVQNATVCLYLNLTTCLFIHTIIPYFYSKWILLTRVKTLFYRTLLLWCTSNIFKHLYSYLDFIRFPWQSLHPWKKSSFWYPSWTRTTHKQVLHQNFPTQNHIWGPCHWCYRLKSDQATKHSDPIAFLFIPAFFLHNFSIQ